jgi:NADH:ubiquinone oxidoreductase subunit 5 (subunit L)/multisubunit Na+/H+ antiporter MnhA subunit
LRAKKIDGAKYAANGLMTSRASEQFITLMPVLFYSITAVLLVMANIPPGFRIFRKKRKMVDNRLIINHLRERKTGI